MKCESTTTVSRCMAGTSIALFMLSTYALVGAQSGDGRSAEQKIRQLSRQAPLGRDVKYKVDGYVDRKTGAIRQAGHRKKVDDQASALRRKYGAESKKIEKDVLGPLRRELADLNRKVREERKKRSGEYAKARADLDRGKRPISKKIGELVKKQQAETRKRWKLKPSDPAYKESKKATRDLEKQIAEQSARRKKLEGDYKAEIARITERFAETLGRLESDQKKKGREVTDQRKRLRKGWRDIAEAIDEYRASSEKKITVSYPTGREGTTRHELPAIKHEKGVGCSAFVSIVLHQMEHGADWKKFRNSRHQGWGDSLAVGYGLSLAERIKVKDVLSGAKKIPEGVFMFDVRDAGGLRRDRKNGHGHVGFVAADAGGATRQYQYSGTTDGLATGDFKSYLRRSLYGRDPKAEVALYPIAGYRGKTEAGKLRIELDPGLRTTHRVREGESRSIRITGRVVGAAGTPGGVKALGIEDGARKLSTQVTVNSDGRFDYRTVLGGPHLYLVSFILPEGGGRKDVRILAHDGPGDIAVKLSGDIKLGAISEREAKQTPSNYVVSTAGGERGRITTSQRRKAKSYLHHTLKAQTSLGNVLIVVGAIGCYPVSAAFTGGAATPACVALSKVAAVSVATSQVAATANYAIDRYVDDEKTRNRLFAAVEAGQLAFEVLTPGKNIASAPKALKFLQRFNQVMQAANAADIGFRVVSGKGDHAGTLVFDTVRVGGDVGGFAEEVYSVTIQLGKVR